MPALELLAALLVLWLILYPLPDLLGRRFQLNALVGDGKDPVVAITYDVGTGGEWEAILEDLKAAGIPAALFVSGRLAEEHPALVRRTRDEGHDVGVRGYAEKAPGRLSPWMQLSDLRRGRQAVADALGAQPTWYRPVSGPEALVSVWAPGWFGLRRVLGQVELRGVEPEPARYLARLAFPGAVLRLRPGATRSGLAAEIKSRLGALGMTPVQLDAVRPEWSPVRRGWFWWEGEFTRRYDVETLPATDGGPPIFRLGVARYEGQTLFDEHRSYPAGTPMAELHFVNQTLGQDSTAPTRAMHVVVRLRRGFADAARAIQDDPRYAACELVGGVTVLDVGDAIGRMGLRRTPARGFRMWLMRVYLVFLMGVFHRQGFRVFRRFGRLKPVWVWLSRDEFLERFVRSSRSARGS